MILALVISAISFAQAPPCERVRAESAEVSSLPTMACEESKETRRTFMAAIPEVQQICRTLEAEVAAGAPKLTLGTEDEMKSEAMTIKQRHMLAQPEITAKVSKELLVTPLDRNDPSYIPPVVSSECGTEVENFGRYRRNVLRALNELFVRLGEFDESLFPQAEERALPNPAPVKTKNVR